MGLKSTANLIDKRILTCYNQLGKRLTNRNMDGSTPFWDWRRHFTSFHPIPAIEENSTENSLEKTQVLLWRYALRKEAFRF